MHYSNPFCYKEKTIENLFSGMTVVVSMNKYKLKNIYKLKKYYNFLIKFYFLFFIDII
jgi:hypothetical protein